MIDHAVPTDRHLLARILLIALAGAIMLFGGTYLFLSWSTESIDKVSIDRQIAVVRYDVGLFRAQVDHDQESVTVWDDAIEAVRQHETAAAQEWMRVNLGAWMLSYFGHDGAFVVAPTGELVHAHVAEGELAQPIFDHLRPMVAPMLAELRDKLIRGDTAGLGDRVLTVGVSDVHVVNGRAAIVSLKPIVSDSGTIEQVKGEEYVHLALRYVDGELLEELAEEHGLAELQFSLQKVAPKGFASLPLAANNGTVVGYFSWDPYRPATAFLSTIVPGLTIIGCLIAAVVSLLLAQYYRRTMNGRAQDARIRHVASHDGLTGLLNRSAFEKRLDALLAERGDRTLAVLYLDLDRFKQVNDTLGHAAGDAVIREAAERIRRFLPPGAQFCRAGGDEFNLALPCGSTDEVEEACQAIIGAMNAPFQIEGRDVFVGITVGAAVAPLHGTLRGELTRKADMALYSAKDSGRGTYALFGAGMDALVRERAETERDLHAALDDKQQFEVVYQPKYDAQTGEIKGAEALVRWHHPQRGLVSPVNFIPVAEETGLIRELGRFVLEEACRSAAAWDNISVAVNVSVVQLRDPYFAMTVVSVLGATGLNPRRLELEVTETAWSDWADDCLQNMKTLRDLGIRIALDDFGTGFSTFGRLQATDVDHLKIDKIFIDRLGSSPGDEAIVRAIIDLGKAKGMLVTAEGVETAEQQNFLRHAGCDELQGYLLSKPISRGALEEIIARKDGSADPQRLSA